MFSSLSLELAARSVQKVKVYMSKAVQADGLQARHLKTVYRILSTIDTQLRCYHLSAFKCTSQDIETYAGLSAGFETRRPPFILLQQLSL